jgi:hypothetical protein
MQWRIHEIIDQRGSQLIHWEGAGCNGKRFVIPGALLTHVKESQAEGSRRDDEERPALPSKEAFQLDSSGTQLAFLTGMKWFPNVRSPNRMRSH